MNFPATFGLGMDHFSDIIRGVQQINLFVQCPPEMLVAIVPINVDINNHFLWYIICELTFSNNPVQTQMKTNQMEKETLTDLSTKS